MTSSTNLRLNVKQIVDHVLKFQMFNKDYTGENKGRVKRGPSKLFSVGTSLSEHILVSKGQIEQHCIIWFE